MDRPSLAVIGPGRVGLALAARAGEVGIRCCLVRGRRPVDPERRLRLAAVEHWDTWDAPCPASLPEVVMIAVPDPEVASVADRLARSSGPLHGCRVLHTSGLLTADVLEPCRAAGAAVASWHPLQSFTAGAGGDVWSGVACAVEGDAEAVDVGFQLASSLAARPWRIDPSAKVLYHAAAAVAGNLTFVLVAAAADLLEGCGIDRSTDPHPLAPLVATMTGNALSLAPGAGLTGPIARRDHAAIRLHLQALPPRLAAVYETLAREAVPEVASDWLD